MKDVGNSTSGLDKVKTGFGNVAKAAGIAAVAVGAGAVAFGVKAVNAASDLQQSIGGVDAVFKNNADVVHEWAKNAALDVGLSETAYNNLAVVIGSQLKNMGVAADEVTGKTNSLITTGADLAAQFGGTTADAVSALSSLMRGETDPIERYGVSIKQADISAKLAAMGLTGLTGEAAKAAKTQATLALLTEQTADAQGAFGRESDTLAGQQQRLHAQLDNLTATLGTFLLPIITKIVTWLSDNLKPAFEALTKWFKEKGKPMFEELAKKFETDILPALKLVGGFITGTLIPALAGLVGWVIQNRDWLSALGVVVLTVVGGIKAYNLAMAVWKTITTTATAIQLAFNLAMAANPIGLIILAVAALVAGLIYFFTQTETGKKIVTDVWQGILDAISAVVSWWNDTAWPTIKKIWGYITDAFELGAKAVGDFMDDALAVIKKVWEYSPIGLIVTNWDAIVKFFKELPGKIKTAFGAAITMLKQIGVDILTGLSNGISSGYVAVSNFFGDIWSKITSPFSDAGNWLWDAGKAVLQGLLDGISSMFTNVKNTLNNLTDLLPDWKGPAAKDKTLLTGAGESVIDGFIKGLQSRYGAVRQSLAGLTREVAGTDMGTISAPSFDIDNAARDLITIRAEANAADRAGNVYNITVVAPVGSSSADIGRELTTHIRAYERQAGARR